MKLLTLFFSITFSQQLVFAQQDPIYTQFWNVNTSYNPANSGLFYKQQVGINYRNQLDGVNGAPNILMASYNTKIDKYKSGIGFNYKYETVGTFKQNRFDLNYSYHFNLGNEQKLAIGASAGITQLSFDAGTSSNLISGSGFGFAANFGLVYKTKKLTLGLSSTQINEARIEEVYFKFTGHYYLSASYNFDLSDNFTLKPQLLVKTDLNFLTTDINILAIYKKQYWIGITNRNFDNFCFMAGIDFKEKYRIGYSYDLPISKLIPISKGSHEIVLGFLLK